MFPATAPCSELNSSGLGNILISSNSTAATALPKIFGPTQETLRPLTDSNILTSGVKGQQVLSSLKPTSDYSLIEFLSGNRDESSSEFKTLQNVLLYTESSNIRTFKSLNGDYFTAKTGYTDLTSEQLTAVLKDLLGETNSTSGKKFLLNSSEIYDKTRDTSLMQSDISSDALIQAIDVSDRSFLFIAMLASAGTLNADQTTRFNAIQNTNLRFFGAFFIEYCFYRSRYEWMLKEYFNVYTDATKVPSSIPNNTLNTTTTNTNAGIQGSDSAQQQYLKALLYQMACVKSRMRDMINLLNKINVYYQNLWTEIDTDLNGSTAYGSNGRLQQTINALQASSVESTKYLHEAELQKAAMDYAGEKNRYGNLLLGLYAFLNLSALAIIYRVANS